MGALFSPFELTPDIKLEHRIVLAPLTRNRATQSENQPRTWIPNALMQEYYTQRASQGGLLVTEATWVKILGCWVSSKDSGNKLNFRGAPGIFTEEQYKAWRPIVESVHAKGAFIICQLFHQGRGAHSRVTGMLPESSSPWAGIPTEPYEVPEELDQEGINRVQQEFVAAAQHAIDIGFDAIEIHAGNGYLFDQFHHTNINQRTDQYGGSIENRCRFTIETAENLCKAIGNKKVGVRLSPYAFFNEAKGEQRLETWTFLCRALAPLNLAYVYVHHLTGNRPTSHRHLIEPRFDEIRNESEKVKELGGGEITLKPFKAALGKTPVIVAGGYNPTNCQAGLRNGEYDLVAFGRFFTSNPNLTEKLKTQQPLYHYQRQFFYGPFENNAEGYTQHTGLRLSGAQDVGKAQMAE